MAQKEQEIFELGGKWYRAVGTRTLQHDHFLAGATRQAGSERWMLRPGESHESLGARILGDIMASGKAFDMLGGLLIPVDTEKWTPGVAKETAVHLAGLTDPDEKQLANSALLGLVLEFFVNGLAYWMTSETSSTEEGSEPGPIGATTTSASGRESSGR